MAWYEANRVDYLFGLARNARLEEMVQEELIAASLDAIRSGRPARRFKDFRYMENRIKECQLDLFADRTSAATMRANQLRLWFASMAYVLLCALRRIGLAHTRFADATCGAIRLRLLKLGALVRISVRRVKVAIASACPWQDEFALARMRLPRAIG